MRVLGLPIPFTGERRKALNAVPANRGGWFRILESFTGAWQTNTVVDFNTTLSYHAVYACITLIASDIAKLRLKLIERKRGVWTEIESPASPLFYKPNPIQTRIQFFEGWLLSKLTRGNTYVLKVRDASGKVARMYVLDPARVTPLVSDDGQVFYQLATDNIAGITNDVIVPASEIIHDRFNCLFHPLVGTSPIFAAAIAVTHGLNIQKNASWFFGNKSQPGGILSAPGSISDETARRLKEHWESEYSGAKAGKIAVIGDDLKFQQMAVSAQDSQLIEQLKWTAEIVCSTFHVPPYKIGVGALPSYNNVQALNVEYYSQALQRLIEDIEACLDDGLGHGPGLGVEFDLDGLLRMDSVTQMEVLEKGKSVMTLDERRRKLDLAHIEGGDTVYLQQQDHSIEAIAARDKLLIEQASNPAPAPVPAPAPEPSNDNSEAEAKAALYEIMKGLAS